MCKLTSTVHFSWGNVCVCVCVCVWVHANRIIALASWLLVWQKVWKTSSCWVVSAPKKKRKKRNVQSKRTSMVLLQWLCWPSEVWQYYRDIAFSTHVALWAPSCYRLHTLDATATPASRPAAASLSCCGSLMCLCLNRLCGSCSYTEFAFDNYRLRLCRDFPSLRWRS